MNDDCFYPCSFGISISSTLFKSHFHLFRVGFNYVIARNHSERYQIIKEHNIVNEQKQTHERPN